MTVTHLVLVGPTAAGKSELALGAAARLSDVEIVSADSMQLYRGLDVGTAKPSAADRAAVTHHLLDVADPGDEWSVVRYQAAARATLADLETRGKRALLVGGTGLYVRAVIDGLTFPPEDIDVRRQLEDWVATPDGARAAYEELARVDTDAAVRIEPGNVRRIARALEVYRATGERFSSFGSGLDTYGPPALPVRMAGVWLPRDVLASRIADRFAAMRDAGLVEEVRGLAAGPLSRTARQAIGYKEVLSYLEGLTPTLDDALDEAQRRTRALARRQRMWFRRDPRVRWAATAVNPCAVLPALLAIWGA